MIGRKAHAVHQQLYYSAERDEASDIGWMRLAAFP